MILDDRSTATVQLASASLGIAGRIPVDTNVVLTVAVTSSGIAVPTGTVLFYLNGNATGNPVPLVGGKASYSLSSPLPLEPQSWSSAYSGDANTQSANSNKLSFTVENSGTLSISYTGPASVGIGSAITVMGRLAPPANSSPAPTGGVMLLDNGVSLANSYFSQQAPYVVSFTVNTASQPLSAGAHIFSLQFLGDVYYAQDTSSTVSVTVLPVTIAPTSNPPQSLVAVSGSPVSFIATTNTAAGAPMVTGTMQFYDGSTAIGAPVPLASGAASYSSASFGLGRIRLPHPIWAIALTPQLHRRLSPSTSSHRAQTPFRSDIVVPPRSCWAVHSRSTRPFNLRQSSDRLRQARSACSTMAL